jgi:HemY protein
MIRIIFFLLVVGVIASGIAWLADRPGEVVLTWMGYRVETSLLIAAIGLIVLILTAILLWSLLRFVLRSPQQISSFFRRRHAIKGYLAISRGLIAVAGGDLRLAQRAAAEARQLSPQNPLSLLLTAQAAQLAGNRDIAERAFKEMTQHNETRLLGLRGLYIEAQRHNDNATARRVSVEAANAAPWLAWANQAVFDDRCAAADWSGALAALENMKKALDKSAYRRRRAVLLTARALSLDGVDPEASHRDVREAVKLAPDLVPAAALAGHQLAEKGEQRKARRILEKAWIIRPHPELAEAYANLRLGDSVRERLARMQKLAAMTPEEIEGALAVARAAIDAGDFTTARAALEARLAEPTRRVAILMAEIEEKEHGDHGRVREWMNRAMRASGDPAWTANGFVSDCWMPVSPNGQLDGFEWRVPLTEIDRDRPIIEITPNTKALASEVVASTPIETETREVEVTTLGPEMTPETEMSDAKMPGANPLKKSGAKAEPVIPLIHAPDDPGPNLELDGGENSGLASTQDWHHFR